LLIVSAHKTIIASLHSTPWTGLLSTAGGLVFGGTNEGHFFALDDFGRQHRFRGSFLAAAKLPATSFRDKGNCWHDDGAQHLVGYIHPAGVMEFVFLRLHVLGYLALSVAFCGSQIIVEFLADLGDRRSLIGFLKTL
jgi:hypothetical protein